MIFYVLGCLVSIVSGLNHPSRKSRRRVDPSLQAARGRSPHPERGLDPGLRKGKTDGPGDPDPEKSGEIVTSIVRGQFGFFLGLFFYFSLSIVLFSSSP